MLRCEWTLPAARQFAHAQDHCHALDPTLSGALAQRVLAAVRTLGEQPDRGRPGRVSGTREWRVTQTPYSIVYRVHGDALQFLHFRLEALDWMPRATPMIERLEPVFAALITALLHVLMALVLLYASTPTVSTPQGTAGGSRMKVEFLGETSDPSSVPESAATPTTAPVRSTLVETARNPLPPDAADKPEHVRPMRPHAPVQRRPSRRPPTPATTQPLSQAWTGRPPGMLDQDVAPDDDGLGDSDSSEQGYRNDRRGNEPSMEVGSYQVIYDLRSETQLRAWKAQGMKEISIILPGTQHRMVCPLEVALRRGSGKCRMLPPDSPELQNIGDAREVISIMEVYRRGEPVWRGPGPYR